MNPLNKNDRIDRILASDDELIPSSGFLSAVMESVHKEAATPPPIPFPWRRFVPCIVLALGVFGWSAFEAFRYLRSAARQVSLSQLQFSPAAGHQLASAGWIALALVVSLLCWLLARRIAGTSGLL